MRFRSSVLILVVASAGLVSGPGAKADGPPSNDNRADAAVIAQLPFTAAQGTEGATNEPLELWTCEYSGASVWYSYTPSQNQVIIVDTFGSDYDTVLSVYRGIEPIPSQCNVDSWGTEQSRLRVFVEAGSEYLFQISGVAYETGNLNFNVVALGPPANDLRVDAAVIEALPFAARGTTEGATAGPDPDHCQSTTASLWYAYTPSADQELIAEVTSTEVAPEIAVYADDDLEPFACSSAGGPSRGEVAVFAVEAGVRYFIEVRGYYSQADYLLEVWEAPTNNRRAGAVPLDGFPASVEQNTQKARSEAVESKPCGRIDSTLWFSFEVPSDGPVVIDTAGSNFDTVLAVHDSDGLVGCNDDGIGKQSDVGFDATAGVTYLIQAGGYGGDTGDLRVNVRPGSDDPPAEIEWPDVDDALIRPGSRIVTEGSGQCTTNFLFRGTGHRQDKLYIGTAGHCVGGNIGNQVRLGGSNGPAIGTVAYSGWKAGSSSNDFALIELDPAMHSQVHPAMIHYGGPTGLVPLDEVHPGDRVLTYGNSGLRQGIHPANHREGYVHEVRPPWDIYVYTLTAGIWGDSGSAAIHGDGRALGVVVTITVVPPAGNGITPLVTALDVAANEGWPVELQTADVLDPGLLPAVR